MKEGDYKIEEHLHLSLKDETVSITCMAVPQDVLGRPFPSFLGMVSFSLDELKGPKGAGVLEQSRMEAYMELMKVMLELK
jgi:hypothetical protein